MKKFLSILMVLALALSMSLTVFATEQTGSVTITNATVDQTYTIYKIFDASISTDANGATDAVAYSITTDNQFFSVLFGADGKTENAFFEYNANTGSVAKKQGVNDSELIKYLTGIVQAQGAAYTPAATPVVAQSDEVVFDGLPYGYYLITSSLGTAVTINSNTPDVSVIDKNQKPGSDFDKQVQTGVDTEGNPVWGDSNSANIGDKITYQIDFEATNYDGDKKIKYYQVYDKKGKAIWAEFNSFRVFVGGVELTRGYYLAQGGDNTDNWEFLGDWSAIPEADRDRNDAQWYLVHLGYDEYRVTIPWLEGHTVTDVTNDNGVVTSYTLNFPENAASKFDSPVRVEIIYDAVIEANAVVGGAADISLKNSANASWTSEHETGSTGTEEVVTYVYGIGLLKDDASTGINLAGAKFRIYRDAACTQPVYVIPTDVDGVYVVDSLGTAIDGVSGTKKETTRQVFAAYIEDYLKDENGQPKVDENGQPLVQDNLVVSQVNGKLVVLGLEAGSYFLKEVEAPAGYNALTQPVELVAGQDIRSFYIYAAEDGTVADIQAPDGTHSEHVLNITHTVVHNSKGVVLPSTGGQGTFWLITIGTMLAIGFAVFLITHKKMSVYTD